MRIAITGATGNVGTALLSRLEHEPDIEVMGIARRLPSAHAGPPYERVEWHSFDLADPTVITPLSEALRGVDAVVHLAWRIQPNNRRAELRRTNLGGTRHLINAMREAEVHKLVYASSIGAYAPAPKDRRVTEIWPAAGNGRSGYSVDKAAAEALLDGLERDHPELRITRLRTGLVLQHAAAAEFRRYYLGRFAPSGPPRTRRLLLGNARLRGQAIHAADAAEAYLAALRSDRTGPFNIAAEPVLDAWEVADALYRRVLRLPLPLLRLALRTAWRARLIPADPGWLDLVADGPLVDCSRAEQELGWQPRYDAREALRDLVAGLESGTGTTSPVLRALPRFRSGGQYA